MAQPIDYQAIAAACSKDGKIFVAVGRGVLAIPAAKYALIQSAPVRPDSLPPFRLAPPDPTEPEGCHGHPVALSGIGRGNAVFLPPGYSSQTSETFDGHIVPVRNVHIFKYLQDWPESKQAAGMSNGVEEQFCENKQAATHFIDGIKICRYVTEDGEPDNKRAASYLIPQSMLRTFTSTDLAFTCSSISYIIGGLAPCDLTLVADPDLAVSISFYRPSIYGEAAFPQRVVDLVKAVMQEIERAREPHYPWPGVK